MSTTLGGAATDKVIERLTREDGPTAIEATDIRAQNVAAELAEKAGPMRYPTVNVFCERLVNDLREKFRTFAGRAFLAIEVRHSQDRLEGLGRALEAYADAVAATLDGARGDWGDGIYYAGGYEVAFNPVKRGGRNFVQTATVKLTVEISR